jgi:hypothetical protein
MHVDSIIDIGYTKNVLSGQVKALSVRFSWWIVSVLAISGGI